MTSFAETRSTQALSAGHRPHETETNLGQTERVASLVAGGAMLALGLMRRLPGGLLMPLAGAALLHRGWTGRCAVYNALGIDRSQEHSQQLGVQARHGRKVTWTIHVNRPANELYDFWRRFENLPTIMRHLESVTPQEGNRSHWVARAPFGKKLEWDAEIINERQGEMIAWRSLPGSQVDTAGSVHFRTPAFREGTEVVVSLKYDPPGGKIVTEVAEFLGQGLESVLEEDLQRFKQLMEAGELTTAKPRPMHRNGAVAM